MFGARGGEGNRWLVMAVGIFSVVETYLTEQILGVLIDRRHQLSNGKLLQPNPVALETAQPIREQSGKHEQLQHRPPRATTCKSALAQAQAYLQDPDVGALR